MSDAPISPVRLTIFAAVVGAIALATGAYLYVIRVETPAASSGPARVVDDAQRQALIPIRQRAYVAFRDMTPGPAYGRLAFRSLDDDAANRVTTLLPCNRLYFSVAAGMCLTIARDPAGFRGYLIDQGLDVSHAIDLPGMPSRTRISRDSTLAAYTAFVAGDSYLASGLSTRTRIVDVRSGGTLGDLESFVVTRDGTVIHAVDFNFWGVTFTRDANRFYATLGTGGRILLVEGDVAALALRVIAEDVECPSLSPDETHIAFKKRFGSGLDAWWQPAVLDLASKEVRLLPEPKHIDDQIEWLDEGHILYAVGHSVSAAQRRADVWKLAIDGATPPSIFITDGESPAVVRP
jgi:hypothetical protein